MKLREARLCIKTIFQALKKCFFHTALMKLRQAWLCIKTIFQALIFFRTALMKLRQARLCKKTIFQALIFFVRMPLVKSANSTLLPRLKLAPNCADACNTERPSAYCGVNLPAFKNKNLRGPGPQAFGFLTSSRAVFCCRVSLL